MVNYLNETPGERTSPIAPLDGVPERVGNVYERKMAPDRPGGRGPMYFEEGLASDTDLPREFLNGIQQGYVTAAGRNNHNQNVYEKSPEETMRERVHVGSASWVEAPTYLGGFAAGSSREGERTYLQVTRDGGSQHRQDAAVVRD